MKINKIISFGIIILMLFSLFTTVTFGEHQNIFDEEKTTTESDISDVSLQSDFSDGDGTESDPYQISNWTHLDNVRNNLTENFTLINDLDNTTDGYDDLASSASNDGKGWNSIGDSTNPFTGTFDGQNYTISDLYINRSDEEMVGLFGRIELVNDKCWVKNLDLIDINITGNEWAGGLVGSNLYATVEDVYTTGKIDVNNQYGGGISGRNLGIIKDSYSTTNIEGGIEIGGITGTNTGSDAEIINSYATGNITSYLPESISGDSMAGGLVGYNANSGTVEDSYATGDVFGDERYVGGLVGSNYATVQKSYAIGDVSCDKSEYGELLGENVEETFDSFALEREGINLIGDQSGTSTGRVTNATEQDMKNIDLYKSNDTSDLEGDYDNLSDPWNITPNWVDDQPSYPYHGNSWTIDQVSEVYFDVNITHPLEGDEYMENKNITIEYNVTNTGTENGTQDIEFFVDNTSISIEEDVFLEPDQYYNSSFNWTTESPYEERNLKVESNNTYDDVNITVLQYPYFTVNITSPEDGKRYLVNDTVTVNYTVRNIGDVNDTQDMEFYVNDTFMESEESIHLTSNETYESSFDYTIGSGGEYDLLISSENETDEITIFVELSPLHTLSYQPFGEKVNSTQDLKIKFDQEMNMTSIEQSIKVHSPSTTYDISDGEVKWVESHILFNFRPDFLPYESETEYTVVLNSSIAKDDDGLHLDGNQNGTEGGDFIWSFESEDSEPPEVVSIKPSGDNVDPESNIIIEFSEEVKKTSVHSAFKYIASDGTEYDINDGVYSWPDNKTFVFYPDEEFDVSTQYEYSVYEIILTTEVRDLNDNNLDKEYSHTFKTKEEKVNPLQFSMKMVLLLIPAIFIIFGTLIILGALIENKESKDKSYVSLDDDESYDKKDDEKY